MDSSKTRNYKIKYVVTGVIFTVILLYYVIVFLIFRDNKCNEKSEFKRKKMKIDNITNESDTTQSPFITSKINYNSAKTFKSGQKSISDIVNNFYSRKSKDAIKHNFIDAKIDILDYIVANTEFHKLDINILLVISRDDLFENSVSRVMDVDSMGWTNLNYEIILYNENKRNCLNLDDPKKEWLEELAKAIFKSDTGLFELVSETNNTYKPVEVKIVSNELLQKYRFVGRILAEILINNISINFPLADYIFGYILGQKLTMTDVKYLDEVLYNSLISLIESSDNNFLSEFSFNDINNDFYDVAQIKDKVVTKDNVRQYVALRMYSKYIGSVKKQLDALKYEFLKILFNL